MSNQPVPEKLLARDVSYKVGEECRHWLKLGEYPNQQAIEEGWLDAHGKLTPAGLQAIISEREMAEKRRELTRSLIPKARSLKGRIKLRGLSIKTPASPRTRKQAKSEFIIEVKTLLAKIGGKFVHLAEEGEDHRLVVRIPNEKGGTTSHTLRGAVSDIQRSLDALIEEYD